MKHIASSIVLAGLMLAGGIGAPAATVISAGGHYEGAFGPTIVTFQGVQKRDGTFVGQFEQHNPGIGLTVHAGMDCVVPLGDGRALASGVINLVKRASGDWESVQPGMRILIVVVDGGVKRGTVDLVSPWWEIPDWATCEDIAGVALAWYEFFRDFGLFAPLSGNVQVVE
jgi:hypothetical protein